MNKIHAPRGIATSAPTTKGIIGFHSACFAAFGSIGIITNTSMDNASKTAWLGNISKLNNDTITRVVPKPENPRINPPADTMVAKSVQYNISKFA